MTSGAQCVRGGSGGPPGLGHERGGLGSGTDKGGAHGCLLGSGHSPPRAGEGLARPPSCGCNWFSSLSLPPSLPACFSLLFLSLSVLPPAHSCPRPPYFCCLWLLGAPPSSALPSRLVLPAFSLSAPGGRYTVSSLPNTTGEGLGAQTPGPGLTNRLIRKCKAHPGGGPVPGAQTRLSLLVCLSHALLCPRPRQPAPLRLLCLSPPPPSQRP